MPHSKRPKPSISTILVPDHNPFPVPFVFFIVSLVVFAIWPEEFSFSMHLVIFPLPVVYFVGVPLIESLSIHHIILELSNVLIPINFPMSSLKIEVEI